MNKINKVEDEQIQKDIFDKLVKKNLRITNTRKAILSIFLDGHHSHTIRELQLHLKKMGHSLTIATIYNNISLLLDVGVLLAYFDREQQEATYELNLSKNKIHTHFFNLNTKKYFFLENSKEIVDKIMEKCKNLGYDLEFGILSIVVTPKQQEQ